MIFEYDIFEYVYLQETIETWPTLQMPWTSHSEASGNRNQAMASDWYDMIDRHEICPKKITRPDFWA